MVGHGGSSAGEVVPGSSADSTSPIPSHCASIVVTSTLRVNKQFQFFIFLFFFMNHILNKNPVIMHVAMIACHVPSCCAFWHMHLLPPHKKNAGAPILYYYKHRACLYLSKRRTFTFRRMCQKA